MKRYYKVIKLIPGVLIDTCDIIEKIGNKFYLKDTNLELESITDEIIANYTIEVNIHKPIFKINDYALVKFDSGIVRPCFIINFNEISGNYIIKCLNNDDVRAYSVKKEHLSNTKKYFYVDSNSIINHSFTGLNPQMDEWLKKSKNFFDSYDDCLTYKKYILM